MATEAMPQLGVCPVCDEVFEINGELPVCECCLNRLDRWTPQGTEVVPVRVPA